MSRLLRSVAAREAAASTVSARAASTSASRNAWFFSSETAASHSYSSMLSDRSAVYQVVSDTVRPKFWEDYLKHKENLLSICTAQKDFHIEHEASWKFIYGDVAFRALHLFKYPEGFSDIDKTRLAMKSDAEYQKEHRAGAAFLNQQSNEFYKSFSFWPVPDKRTGANIYDIRSYVLKPGSMYDWSNYWAKGIVCRTQVRPDIPYAGMFSQLGNLHTIHHIWVYSDLVDRKNCRESTWNVDLWSDVVTNTVPLIRSMSTRILEPLPFSPTQ